MKYEKARKQIKSGDIVFFQSDGGLIGKVISFFTKSVYSHVGIAFWMVMPETGDRRLLVLEAWPGGRRVDIEFEHCSSHGAGHTIRGGARQLLRRRATLTTTGWHEAVRQRA